jgi:predicted Zn-dependent protease
MNKTKWATITAGLILTAIAGAQNGTTIPNVAKTLALQQRHRTSAPATQVTEQQRIDSIWYGATNRISQQADLWYEHGEYLPAIMLLRFETQIFPYDFDSCNILGWLQESTNDPAGALATYIGFRQKNPGDPDGPYMEAMYYYRKQVYAKVPPLLEPLLKLSPPPHPNVYRELAHSYEKMNLLADAKRVWTAYMAVAPTDGAAKTNLDRIEKKLKGQIPMNGPNGGPGGA